MSVTKTGRVNIYIDQQAAQAAYDKLILQQVKWNKSIDAGKASGKSMISEMKKLDDVNSSLKKLQEQIDKGLKPSIAQQTTLVVQLRNELKRLSESDPLFTAKLENFKKQNAELQRMNANVQAVTTSHDKLGVSFQHVLTRIAEYASIYTIFNTVKGFLTSSIQEASQAEQGLTKLKNILDNVGRSDAFERLKIQADEMAKKFQFIDNDEVIEVFQKLITWGKLTEGQLNELTPVIVDFAYKTGRTLPEATEEMTKALEGSSRVLKNEFGIAMKDGATVADRMKIIMTQLKPAVDGAAEAYGNTFAGSVQTATQELANLEEEVGNKLIPVLTKLLKLVDPIITGLTKIGRFTGKSFLTAGAEMFADKKLNEVGRENERAVTSLLAPTENADPKTKQAFLDNLNKKIQVAQTQLNDARWRGDKKLIESLDTSVFIYTKARDQLSNDIKSETGDPFKKVTGEDPSKKIDDAARKLAELKKQAQEFLSQLNDEDFLAKIPNHLQAVALAAKKYFETIDILNKDFSEHLISEPEFKKGLGQAEEIYKDKIHDLNNDKDAVLKPEIVPQLPDEGTGESIAALKTLSASLTEQLTPDLSKFFSTISGALNDPTTKEIIDTVETGINDVMNVWQTFTDLQNQQEQRHLQTVENNNNLEKAKYSRMLNGKLISNQAYQQKIAELDAEAAQEKEAIAKKQFERNKRMQIAQAIIGGAEAIVSTLAAVPGPIDILSLGVLRTIQVGLVAATTAAQIAAISSAKYAEGGKVLGDGKIDHSQNVPTQPGGDNVLAFVRRGEVILNERQQAALGGPGVFAGIGVPGFGPQYKTRPYMAIDTSGIAKTFTNLRYATGGVVGAGASPIQDNSRLEFLMQAILDNITNPVAPVVNSRVVISLKQITDAEDQLARIKANAILQ